MPAITTSSAPAAPALRLAMQANGQRPIAGPENSAAAPANDAFAMLVAMFGSGAATSEFAAGDEFITVPPGAVRARTPRSSLSDTSVANPLPDRLDLDDLSLTAVSVNPIPAAAGQTFSVAELDSEITITAPTPLAAAIEDATSADAMVGKASRADGIFDRVGAAIDPANAGRTSSVANGAIPALPEFPPMVDASASRTAVDPNLDPGLNPDFDVESMPRQEQLASGSADRLRDGEILQITRTLGRQTENERVPRSDGRTAASEFFVRADRQPRTSRETPNPRPVAPENAQPQSPFQPDSTEQLSVPFDRKAPSPAVDITGPKLSHTLAATDFASVDGTLNEAGAGLSEDAGPAPRTGGDGSRATIRHHVTSIAEFGQMIARSAQNGSRQITVQLDPAELGQVEVAFEFGREGRLSASVTVDRPETLELLQRDSRSMAKLLSDRGFELDGQSLSFSLSHQGGRSAQDDGRNAKTTDGTPRLAAADPAGPGASDATVRSHAAGRTGLLDLSV